MFLFSRKKREAKMDATLRQVDDVGADAEIKVKIAKMEADKLNNLINRAVKNKDVTLRIFLATGGDRRIK